MHHSILLLLQARLDISIFKLGITMARIYFEVSRKVKIWTGCYQR